MNTTHIYIIRHGQSEANLKNIYIGHTDYDLTPRGHDQAELVAEHFKDIPIDVIYSSDLSRAYSTALHTANAKGLTPIKNKNLREIYAGEWEDVGFDTLVEKYKDDYGVWLKDTGNARCTGGESVAEMQTRFVGEVEKLAKENIGKSIMIFTHATPIRVIKAAWDKLTLDEIKTVPWAANATVTHGVYEDGEFKMLEYGDYSFLGDNITQLIKNV